MSQFVDSEISQTLEAAGAEARYDAAARKLVAQKSILAYILKSSMDEFADVSVKQIADELIDGSPQVSEAAVFQDVSDVLENDNGQLNGSDRIHDMSTEDISILEGTVRYDIRFVVKIPDVEEKVEVIVNIEIQNSDRPNYPIPKRGIYYGSRLISSQRGTIFKNQEYGKIKKVVSIWICENTSNNRSDSINEYLFEEKCRRGSYHEKTENFDLIRVIVMRLGSEGVKSDDNAIRLLSNIFSSNKTADEKKKLLSEEFHINITELINEEVSQMCNLSAGLVKKGKEEGAMEVLFKLVKKGVLSISAPAEEVGISSSIFEQKYKEFYN